jgi:hypothetical protein
MWRQAHQAVRHRGRMRDIHALSATQQVHAPPDDENSTRVRTTLLDAIKATRRLTAPG